MCEIIGIASNKPVSINIVNALKKLEYRGYDSAGLATLNNNKINEKKCSGRVEELEKILFKSPSNGNLGIGHVRWATHIKWMQGALGRLKSCHMKMVKSIMKRQGDRLDSGVKRLNC